MRIVQPWSPVAWRSGSTYGPCCNNRSPSPILSYGGPGWCFHSSLWPLSTYSKNFARNPYINDRATIAATLAYRLLRRMPFLAVVAYVCLSSSFIYAFFISVHVLISQSPFFL